MKKVFSLFVIIVFFSVQNYPLYAYSAIPQFLCEYAMQLYQQGKYDEALYEFNKALLIEADYEPALKYIELIKQIKTGERLEKTKKTVKAAPRVSPEYGVRQKPSPEIRQLLLEEPKRQSLIEKELERFEKALALPQVTEVYAVEEIKKVKPITPTLLTLDDYLSDVQLPVEIQLDKSIILLGKNIQRFLVTHPEIISVERKRTDELLVTGKNIGFTELHIWDDRGRLTVEFQGVFPVIEGLIDEEAILRELEKAGNLKLRYNLDWALFEKGSSVRSLNRTSYSWGHNLGLSGETPYGDIDTYLAVNRANKRSDLSYLTFGLSRGRLGPFKGFDLRGFDFLPSVSNIVLRPFRLRGAMLSSPMFKNKLSYTAFWGRETSGGFVSLTPGVSKAKNSFLNGLSLNFTPTKKQNYKFTLAHGWGRDRPADLNAYGYDLVGNLNLKKWRFEYEIAQDSERFAHLFRTSYTQSRLGITTELRDIDRNFQGITANASEQGESGVLVNLNYAASDKLGLNASMDVYRSRLTPALDNDTRLNERLNWMANYQVDPSLHWSLSYALQNQLGSLSQYRYQSFGPGISKRFKFLKDVTAYAYYYHQENKNFTTPSINYINEKINAGLRFNLTGAAYYYLNKELNWFEERATGIRTLPQAVETGIDWSDRLGKGPFYGNFRFTFRDEEDAASNLSFLSGEDYIEGYSEFTYKPTEDKQFYISARMRNVWADNPTVDERIEYSFNAGMRYLWDTGIRWEAIGTIDGFVFNDYNQNGLKEVDEPGIGGVKLRLGKVKSVEADASGYYKFPKVKAKRAYVSIDTKTIPPGYLLISSATQEVAVAHKQAVKVNFGLSNRSEISGIAFEDMDADGQLGRKDIGMKGIVLTLEDGTQAVTDSAGRYFFRKVTVGSHKITLDLGSVSTLYIPTLPIYKDIELFEGVTYNYNIPFKKVVNVSSTAVKGSH